MKQIVTYFLISLSVLVGCSEGGDPVKHMDALYFPLQTGNYQIYSVEHNIYSEVDPPQLLSYELKTEVIDSFPSLGGGFTFVIHRSTRSTDSDPWEFLDTWSARVNDYQAVMTEGNISFIQITFPISKNREWDANELNTIGEDLYRIENIGSYQLENDLAFDDALVIDQEDNVNELVRDQREEVYAPRVGLIYKKSVVINYCDSGPCVGQEIIKNGEEYWQVLKEYGQN